MWDVDFDFEPVILELYVMAMKSLLADGEPLSETSPEVKAYMGDLKALAHRADDVLVYFRNEALRRENEAGEPAARKLIIRYFTGRNPLLFRLTTVREMRKVLKEIRKLWTSMKTSGVTEKLTSARRKLLEADAEERDDQQDKQCGTDLQADLEA